MYGGIPHPVLVHRISASPCLRGQLPPLPAVVPNCCSFETLSPLTTKKEPNFVKEMFKFSEPAVANDPFRGRVGPRTDGVRRPRHTMLGGRSDFENFKTGIQRLMKVNKSIRRRLPTPASSLGPRFPASTVQPFNGSTSVASRRWAAIPSRVPSSAWVPFAQRQLARKLHRFCTKNSVFPKSSLVPQPLPTEPFPHGAILRPRPA